MIDQPTAIAALYFLAIGAFIESMRMRNMSEFALSGVFFAASAALITRATIGLYALLWGPL